MPNAATRTRTSWSRWGWGLLFFGLGLTGAAQMPVFKRYYIADLPGLAWLADFYLTNVMHYALGGILLAAMAYTATRRLRQGLSIAPTTQAVTFLLVIVAASGILRILKNMPQVYFGPTTVLTIDLVHLGSAMLLGIVALAAVMVRRRPVGQVA